MALAFARTRVTPIAIQMLNNACMGGDLATVKLLVEMHGRDLTGNGEGDSPLDVAASVGHLDIVKYLLEEKKCNLRRPGRSTLHHACMKDRNLAVVQYLVEKHGCDPTWKDEQGNTPLHVAAFNGSLDIVKYLIEERQLSIECPGRWGRLPLHNACEVGGNLAVVKYLVEKCGCDPHVKDKQGNSVLNIAAFSGCFDILTYLIQENNCDPNCPGKLGRLPLHDACLSNGNLDMVSYLVENCGCDPIAKDMYKDTPLHLAALSGSLDIVKYFIGTKKCSLRCPGQLDRSPLHRACARNGNQAMVTYLVDQGSNLNCEDRLGLLPLDIAFTGNDEQVICYLQKKMGVVMGTVPHGLPSGSILIKDDITKRWIRVNEHGDTVEWNHPDVQNNMGPMPPEWSVFQKCTGEVIFANMETAVTIKEDPRAALHRYQHALKGGFVAARFMKILIVGAAGVGKSHLLNLVLNEPPPCVRQSTPVLVRPVQVIQTASKDNTSFVKITDKQLYKLLAHTINTCCEKPESQMFKKGETGRSKSPANLHISQISSQSSKGGLELKYSCNNDRRSLEEQLLPYIAKSKEAAPLLDIDWMYFIDSGGQPQFLQLLPAFMHHSNLNIFVLKLCDRISDHPTVEYYDERGNCLSSTTSLLTNKEILRCCAQATQTTDQDGDSRLLIVGTHRDLEHQCDGETRDDKNRELLELLTPSMENTLIYSSADGSEVIFPLNAKTPEDYDRQVTKDLYQSILSTKERIKPKEIPLRWLIFQQEMHSVSSKTIAGVLTFEQCSQIASRLHMKDDTEAALEFFSDLNVILYYPSILSNMVFTNPQSLLNTITEIVKHISYSNDPLFIKARRKGIISLKLLQHMRLEFTHETSLFEAQNLIDLLLHLRIISKCNSDYFMPSLLTGLDTKGIEASLSLHPDTVVPCAVYYENRWLECGVFGFLITSLLSIETWTLAFEGHKLLCVHSNCIKMYYETSIITFVDHQSLIEIHVHGNDVDICPKIKRSVCNAFKVKPQFAFICPCNSFTERHIAKYTSKMQKVFCSKNQQKTFSLSYCNTTPEVWITSKFFRIDSFSILQCSYK